MTDYMLGRHVEHDERSRGFAAPLASVQRSVLWGHHAPVLDQGQIGACTGNATAQLLNTDPMQAARARVKSGYLTEDDALRIYELATQLDSIPGSYPPDDTGSSGLAVAKAGTKIGYFTHYRHTFSFAHFCAALQLQPVIVGTSWTKDMFTPDRNGVVRPTGSVAGGHEYLALGVDYSSKMVTFLNSWGDGWSQDGRFHTSFDDFASLLADHGDVTVPA